MLCSDSATMLKSVLWITLCLLLLFLAGGSEGQLRSLCNDDIALGCINGTIEREERDKKNIAHGRLDQTYQDLYCSLVFSLKVSKLECVDEAVHGCGHLIRAQVIDKYEEVMLGYQAKCSRRVREPSSAGKTSLSTLTVAYGLLIIFVFCLELH